MHVRVPFVLHRLLKGANVEPILAVCELATALKLIYPAQHLLV